jgi:hypothetical protein
MLLLWLLHGREHFNLAFTCCLFVMLTLPLFMVIEGFYEGSEAMLGTSGRQANVLKYRPWIGWYDCSHTTAEATVIGTVARDCKATRFKDCN